jgi:hypothetical protein
MGCLECVESSKGTRIGSDGFRMDARDYKAEEWKITISEEF